MAANQNPIFSLTPDIQWGSTVVSAANANLDGTGTIVLVFTADATNGGYVQQMFIRHAGTNIATVFRVFITNSAGTSSILFREITVAANTISQVAASPDYTIPLNIALPAGYKLNVSVGTTIAAGLWVGVVGGKY